MDNNEELLEEECLYGVFRGKLILSNKKLIFVKKKGLFNKSYEKIVDIPLEEIEECYADVNFEDDCVFRLLFKNNKEEFFEFPGGIISAFTENFSTYTQIQQGKTNRWVSAINLAKEKLQKKPENPLEVLQLRFAKGEIGKEEYEEMKRVLEGKNSP